MTGLILSAPINTALLQLAAKIQELLIIASLTALVTHYLRKEMLSGQGVPLGMIGGGFLFSSLRYFWSPDFWGSLKAQACARYRLSSLLTVSGLLAATVGPSAAILLIPRIRDWNAGGASVFILGTTNDLWPTSLSASDVGSLYSQSNATSYGVCPSSGFFSMWNTARISLYRRNLGGLEWNVSTDLLFSGRNLTLSSSADTIPDSQMYGNWRAISSETAVQGVHLASAILQKRVVQDWEEAVTALPYSALKASFSEYKYHYSCFASSPSRVPVVRIACSDAQSLSSASKDVYFPILPELNCWNTSMQVLPLNLTEPPREALRTRWIPLPQSFGSVSTGLLLERSMDGSSSSALVVGCSVDARWADGTTVNPLSGPAHAIVLDRTTSENAQCQYSAFRSASAGHWTRIQLNEGWLGALTPMLPIQTEKETFRNISTLEKLLMDTGLVDGLNESHSTQTEVWNKGVPGGMNRTVSLEWILANVVADGLSRHGSARTLNTTGLPNSWIPIHYDRTEDFRDQLLSGGSPLMRPSDSVVEEKVTVWITGYAMLASSFTDYLAIAALLLHALLAVIHTCELLWTRRSSSCWDTVTELLTLAHNSRPSDKALKNTGAGITQLATFSKLARIRAVHAAGLTETPASVELLFDDVQGPSTEGVEKLQLLSGIQPRGTSKHRRSKSLGRRSRMWPYGTPAAESIDELGSIESFENPRGSWLEENVVCCDEPYG